MSGLKQPTISRLESGETTLEKATLETVAAFARVFGEPIAEIMAGAGVEKFAGLDPAVVQGAYTTQHLSPAGREAVLAFIEAQAAKEAANDSHTGT